MAPDPASPKGLAPSLGVDPSRGGAVLLVSGEVVGSDTITDEQTGELKRLTEVGWFAGSSFFVTSNSGPFAGLVVGNRVEILQPFTKGKKGWRAQGDPRILTVDGKPVTRAPAAA